MTATNEEIHEFATLIGAFGMLIHRVLYSATRSAMTGEKISTTDQKIIGTDFYNFGTELAKYID